MAQTILKRVWHFLTRLNVAAVLILVLLLLIALGSCFPQLSPPLAADAGRLAGWQTDVRSRYGGLADLLATMGVFRWSRSPVFLVSLALLAVATLVCTLDRWRIVWRRAFHRPVRGSDLAFEATPYTARLTGPSAAALPALVREHLARWSFRVRSETIGDVVYLRGDRNGLAPLATLVTHLAVLLLLLGAGLSIGYSWQETLTIEPGEIAGLGSGRGLAVRNDGFAISRYPDGNVATYQAEVAIIEGEQAVMGGKVRVNEPLIYDGVGFYLNGYGEKATGYRITLLAGRDPGYGLVIAAGFLLLVGLTVSFNFPPGHIYARIEPDGMLQLAGIAERWAGDFGGEFRALVAALERSIRTGEEATD